MLLARRVIRRRSTSAICVLSAAVMTMQSISVHGGVPLVDAEFPGTAVKRRNTIIERVKSLTQSELSQDWVQVRRKLLWAGGLKDIESARPGYGYTGHAFNDWNHCDLTAMRSDESHNENEGRVAGMAFGNQLGPGIKIASMKELGAGGSWSTCMMGCNSDPPQDVAHIQFRARIAFKLVWVPPSYDAFVLVGDNGGLLNLGKPTGRLPAIRDREFNYRAVRGSKYAVEADAVHKRIVNNEL